MWMSEARCAIASRSMASNNATSSASKRSLCIRSLPRPLSACFFFFSSWPSSSAERRRVMSVGVTTTSVRPLMPRPCSTSPAESVGSVAATTTLPFSTQMGITPACSMNLRGSFFASSASTSGNRRSASSKRTPQRSASARYSSRSESMPRSTRISPILRPPAFAAAAAPSTSGRPTTPWFTMTSPMRMRPCPQVDPARSQTATRSRPARSFTTLQPPKPAAESARQASPCEAPISSATKPPGTTIARAASRMRR